LGRAFIQAAARLLYASKLWMVANRHFAMKQRRPNVSQCRHRGNGCPSFPRHPAAALIGSGSCHVFSIAGKELPLSDAIMVLVSLLAVILSGANVVFADSRMKGIVP
jgi:hypothetical protein